MAADLLSTICTELEERLGELKPLVAEYEQLVVAAESLSEVKPQPKPQSPIKQSKPRVSATRKRGSAAGAIKRASSGPAAAKRTRISAVGQAILDALEHGSHTVSELQMVTAMAAKDIRANIGRLQTQGRISKVDRDGKAAYALPSTGSKKDA